MPGPTPSTVSVSARTSGRALSGALHRNAESHHSVRTGTPPARPNRSGRSRVEVPGSGQVPPDSPPYRVEAKSRKTGRTPGARTRCPTRRLVFRLTRHIFHQANAETRLRTSHDKKGRCRDSRARYRFVILPPPRAGRNAARNVRRSYRRSENRAYPVLGEQSYNVVKPLE